MLKIKTISPVDFLLICKNHESFNFAFPLYLNKRIRGRFKQTAGRKKYISIELVTEEDIHFVSGGPIHDDFSLIHNSSEKLA
jgi:hypothetical protein